MRYLNRRFTLPAARGRFQDDNRTPMTNEDPLNEEGICLECGKLACQCEEDADADN